MNGYISAAGQHTLPIWSAPLCREKFLTHKTCIFSRFVFQFCLSVMPYCTSAGEVDRDPRRKTCDQPPTYTKFHIQDCCCASCKSHPIQCTCYACKTHVDSIIHPRGLRKSCLCTICKVRPRDCPCRPRTSESGSAESSFSA